jgi:hypothetical protein
MALAIEDRDRAPASSKAKNSVILRGLMENMSEKPGFLALSC